MYSLLMVCRLLCPHVVFIKSPTTR